MKADLVFTHLPVPNEKWKERTVVMVDVLRTSSTICVALKNGAREVIPFENVPTAMQLAANLPRDNVLLCGEREGKLIEGFNLGNSPLEYTEDIVKDKTLIFCSTNGSSALVKAGQAKSAIVCAFINVNTCLEHILKTEDDLLVVCAGNEGQFALEDTVCGGMLLNLLSRKLSGGIETNDGAEAALILCEKYSGHYLKLLRNCSHGQYLRSIGFEKDLNICARIDSYNIVPVYKDGKVVALEYSSPTMGEQKGFFNEVL